MKKHLPGHMSKTWGFVVAMCKYTPLPKDNSLPICFGTFLEGHFTTTDKVVRGLVSTEDVCKKCLKVNDDFILRKRCCTDPTCLGTDRRKIRG